MTKLTRREMLEVQNLMARVIGITTIDIGDNGDGTWFADIHGLIFEAPSPAELLMEIATMLELQ